LTILKKTAASKRASQPRAAEYTEAFLEDCGRLTHFGRHDMGRLKEAMLFIANHAPLGPKWLDLALKGDWFNHRECRIGGDLLPSYQVEGRLQAPAKEIRVNLYGRHSCLPSLCGAWVWNPGGTRRAVLPSRRMDNGKAKT
jgi:mRNA interferase YafQ